jgi:hypothetical protein
MSDIKELDFAYIPSSDKDDNLIYIYDGRTNKWTSHSSLEEFTVNGTSDNKMFYNDYDKTEKLKAKCWICQKDISVHQMYNFVTAKEKITISCCQKEQVVELTEKQIKETNAQGVYWAFMC